MTDQGAGPAQDWTSGEVLSLGWEITKKQWPVLIFGPLIAWIIGAVPGQIVRAIMESGAPRPFMPLQPMTAQQTMDLWARSLPATVVATIVGLFVSTFFQGGLIRMWLVAARGGNAQISEVFSGGSLYGRLLLTNLLLWLVVYGGLLLFIVPGIIFGLGFWMAPFYVVDAGMGPMEAMRASWRTMIGQKLNVFGYGFWSFLVAILGLMACCVGILPATAVISVGYGIIFTRLSGRAGGPPPSPYAAPGPYGAGPMPPPGGGWGAA